MINYNQLIITILMAVMPILAHAQVENNTSCGPVPTENQLRWQDMEMYAFIHYSLNSNQLRELLTNYGDIFEVWFDGANGGDGWYGGANETRKIDRTTYYDWPETYKMIRQLQPKCLIWNDGSDRGDLRWVGTEAGNVGETNWSLLNHDGEVSWSMLHYGLETGDSWVPGETNTSIRPGWFYHDTENEHVKSLSKLMDTYYKSVGRNSTLLLNFPIAPNGRIHPTDSLRDIAFKKMIDEVFKTDLANIEIVY